MSYEVHLTEPFEADVARLFDWLFGFNSRAAFRFRDVVEAEALSLSDFPQRYATADETELYLRPVRRKLFKSGNATYRVLFTVYEAGELGVDSLPIVHCLRVLHGAAKPWTQTDGQS